MAKHGSNPGPPMGSCALSQAPLHAAGGPQASNRSRRHGIIASLSLPQLPNSRALCQLFMWPADASPAHGLERGAVDRPVQWGAPQRLLP
eukprot:2653152-Pyramimonas_sp.AAC.1